LSRWPAASKDSDEQVKAYNKTLPHPHQQISFGQCSVVSASSMQISRIEI
jgi:hypothetical protein